MRAHNRPFLTELIAKFAEWALCMIIGANIALAAIGTTWGNFL